MIICVSLNPALDRRLRLSRLRPGEIHRASTSAVASGGKAAHVAMAARALGEPVVWMGLIGGAAGEQCRQGLTSLNIETVVVHAQGTTRTNLELIEQDTGRTTEIREPGDAIRASEVDEFIQRGRELWQAAKGSCVVISGSLPPGAASDVYLRLVDEIRSAGCRALLDTSGDALSCTLASQPDLVKPNRVEAVEALGRNLDDLEPVVSGAQALLDRGAGAVALSLGSRGMVWADRESAVPLLAACPPVTGRSTVGCGDAMLAGIAVGMERRLRTIDIIRLAVACGTANCYADMPAMIDPATVARLIPAAVVRPAPTALKEVRSNVG